MGRAAVIPVMLVLAVLFSGRAGAVDPIQTDANVVTGLDISDSITAADRTLQLKGMAAAIRAPAVLDAIRKGRHGCIGFAMFAWYHFQFPVVVPWTRICTQGDADVVAEQILFRLSVDVELEARRAWAFYPGRPTDLSEALEHAAQELRDAPFAGDRTVINIIGNGDDNVGEGPADARDRIVHLGGTINGVVLGSDKEMIDYYRRELIGGADAFVLAIERPGDVIDVLIRKLLGDVVARAPLGSLPPAG